MNTEKVTRFEIIDHTPCQSCGGDGKEHCSNPDHGFINSLGHIGSGDIGRLGCPTCSYPKSTVVIGGGLCEECQGVGSKGREVIFRNKYVQVDIELQDDGRTLKVFMHDRYNELEGETIDA